MNLPPPFWLQKLIREAGGWISFERFMAEALYHDEHGYYRRSVETIGQNGDFSTSATLCPAFAEALARWALERAKQEDYSSEVTVIEVGAGSGQLARHFIAAWQVLTDTQLRYRAVETAPRLVAALENDGIDVSASLSVALEASAGKALILSNELVDAFPARQLIWQSGDWREVGLELQGGSLSEVAVPFTDAVDAEAPAKPREGQRLFIQPRYHEWLRDELRAWRAGWMLTIDYGGPHPGAECRGYLEQERRDGAEIYLDAGKQDLTCDVNFSDIQRWGEGLGLETIARETQAEFFENWLPDLDDRRSSDEALAFLSNPFGAGSAFFALEQRCSKANR